MPSWSEILLLTYPEKPYSKFLKHLLSVKFYIEDEMRFKIKALLLRSDIHDLFDSHLLGINPDTLTIHLI